MIRVILADDQTLVRSAFAVLIRTASDMEVVGEAGNGREAVDLARSVPADIILMDIRMPVLDGIAATRLITSDTTLPDLKVLVLTTYDTDEHVVDALRAGASGFLVKDTQPAELLAAMRIIAAGEALLSPGPTRRLIARIVDPPTEPSGSAELIAGLSGRERGVLTMVARGRNNTEIADTTGLSPLTVKTHISRIMRKLSARDRAQLVITGYESGLITPGSAEPEPEHAAREDGESP